jgi:hypothetical protein
MLGVVIEGVSNRIREAAEFAITSAVSKQRGNSEVFC